MGEEIFGLPVTEYPDLRATERELKLLDQLYGLYTEVLDTIQVRRFIRMHKFIYMHPRLTHNPHTHTYNDRTGPAWAGRTRSSRSFPR